MSSVQPGSDSRQQVAKLRDKLTETARHARDDVQRLQEPRAQALFETAAETLEGLAKACRDYDAGNEPAWRRQ
ncbi:MAG TPA: hypothetical protein VGL65_11395 [Gemmatimonadales bacterium]|jgi:hypothetical protein